MPTIAELVRGRAADDHPAILFEDRTWSYAEYVAVCAERAALLEELRRPGPFHVGVLLDNVPEFAMWLGAAAVAGAVVVGINPTRRGAELARDITHTDCQLLVTEDRLRAAPRRARHRRRADRILDVDVRRLHRGARPPPRARHSRTSRSPTPTCTCCCSRRARRARPRRACARRAGSAGSAARSPAW